MDKIINTETDSDVKLRHEFNHVSYHNSPQKFVIESKSDLLLKTLL
jgi:hypothetical protein